MGLGSKELDIVIKLKRDGFLNSPRGSIAEIGAQQLSNNFLASQRQMDELAFLYSIKTRPDLPPPSEQKYSPTGALQQPDDAPRSEPFWKWLGFDYAAVDVDNSPGAIPLDLNFDSVPADHIGRYDLVMNAGTTEHVANQLNAMKVVHDLTKTDGIMIHRLPAQGFTNHGLVNYNLKFFWMLSRSNLYKWIMMDFEANDALREIDPDILNTLKTFSPESLGKVSRFRAADCSLTIVMQKQLGIEFVPPLDVRTGEDVNVEVLRQRYWTVFDPARVERELAAKVAR